MEQVEWGEFRLWDLFYELKVKDKLKKENLSDNYKFPAYSSESSNNWIIWYTNNPEFICDENNPIYITFWDHTRNFNIVKQSFSVLDNVKVLKPHIKNESILLFIISSWKKQIPNLWYSRHWKIAKQCSIPLPVKHWEIDFEFINKFIAELEKNYLKEEKYLSDREINAYLQVTWLKDYELTSDELNLLKDFEDGKFEWKEFKIWWDNGLFMINSSKKKFDANKVNILDYWKPYVVRTANNNWLRWYLDEDEQFLNDWNTISFGQDTATMFYQEKSYFTWDKIKVVKSKSEKFNKANAHFFITSMTKAFSTFSRWQSSFNVKIIQNQNIYLPTKDNKPDYELMKTFILAVKKLVIKNIVMYNEERLKVTENVINQ